MSAPLTINVLELTRRAGTLKDIAVSLPVADFAFGDDRIVVTRDINVELHIESVQGGLVVQGETSCSTTMLCRRCLREVSADIQVVIDEIYRSVPDNPDAYVLEGEQVDLMPMVRETMLLALPDAPLCKPDCPGLCPQCGADMQSDPCQCQAQRTDERWSVLDQLRGQLGD